MRGDLTDAMIRERLAARKKLRFICAQIQVAEMQIDDSPKALADCIKLEAKLELAARELTELVDDSSPATQPPGWKITPDEAT